VVQAVVGSSPIAHPSRLTCKSAHFSGMQPVDAVVLGSKWGPILSREGDARGCHCGLGAAWHKSEREAEEPRATRQGDGPPCRHVEQVTRARLEAFLSNPSG
jgi:hypothetical protein